MTTLSSLVNVQCELSLGWKASALQIIKSPRLFALIAQQMVHFTMFHLTCLHRDYTIKQSRNNKALCMQKNKKEIK